MQCDCEPVPCFPRISPACFAAQVESWESVSLNRPYLKREKETGKTNQHPKQPPFQTIKINKLALGNKSKCNLPFLSTAVCPPLQMEGYNIPTVSEAELLSVHLSPPGSERQGAALQLATFPTMNREDPAAWVAGKGLIGYREQGSSLCNRQTGTWDLSWYISFFSASASDVPWNFWK